MKRSEAAELVMMLMGAFPAGKTNESTSRLYEEMLANLDVTRARRAVTKLIRTAKFLPTISEIREEAGSAPLVAPYHREWKPAPSVPQERRLPPGTGAGRAPEPKRVLGPVPAPQSVSGVSAGAARWNGVPAVQQTKGAAASVSGAARRAPEAVKPAAAPADLAFRALADIYGGQSECVRVEGPAEVAIPMARPRPEPQPVVHRRYTAEELEAAMGVKR